MMRKLHPMDHPIMQAAVMTSGIVGRIHSDSGLQVMKDLPEEDIRKLYFELKDLHQSVAILLGEDKDWIDENVLNSSFGLRQKILVEYERRGSKLFDTREAEQKLNQALE